MARPIRVPAGTKAPPREPPGTEPTIPLRLTVTRGALGLELYEKLAVGPLDVWRLEVSLTNLKFPVDLSGGVRLFRHRRGKLEHLGLGLGLDALARWLSPRLKDALGGLVRPVSVWRVPGGIGVGMVGARGALAFDALWAPLGDSARFVITRARGADLAAPALAVTLQTVDTALGRSMERQGRIVSLPRAALVVTREVMPAVGARAPSAEDMQCGVLEGEGDAVLVDLDTTLPPPALGDGVVRALELAELTVRADDDLARGAMESARDGYVAALERAPRHPEISRLIAELDVHAGDRAEAALSMLLETSHDVAEYGEASAILLSRVGDPDGACDALRAATRGEEYAPLSALLFAEMARHEKEAPARLRALDDAVARCPGLARIRWERFEARLERGDVRGALADAEHLEASVSGSRARHEICRTAAQRLLDLGYQRDAGRLFERALRYLPDDEAATAGLGRALLEAGKTNRAVALLERAIALGESRGNPQFDAMVDLGKILAKMNDLPQAIARVREVAAPSERLALARALEAGWREQLGDVAGASLSYARMREALELGATAPVADAIDWLKSGARFEWEVRKDAVSSERHLAVALRLAPHDRGVGDAYRTIAALVAASTKARP